MTESIIQLEPSSACIIVLDNLCEVFGCSVKTDFMSTMPNLLIDK